MARTVAEWIGKSDDTPPSAACKRRILERQGYRCALTDLPFDAKNKPRFDHRIPLWLGGANREGNLQALREEEAHKPKTAAEAKVRAKVNASINARFGIAVEGPKIRSAPFQKTRKAARREQHAATKLPLPARKSPLFQPKEATNDAS